MARPLGVMIERVLLLILALGLIAAFVICLKNR